MASWVFVEIFIVCIQLIFIVYHIQSYVEHRTRSTKYFLLRKHMTKVPFIEYTGHHGEISPQIQGMCRDSLSDPTLIPVCWTNPTTIVKKTAINYELIKYSSLAVILTFLNKCLIFKLKIVWKKVTWPNSSQDTASSNIFVLIMIFALVSLPQAWRL